MSVVYCCYGMYSDIGHSDDCPTRKPTMTNPAPAVEALIERLRPGSECAPWVIEELKVIRNALLRQPEPEPEPTPTTAEAEVTAYKWAYGYLQDRMRSIGRNGWAEDCDGEIEDRIKAARTVAPPTRPAQPTAALAAALLCLNQGDAYGAKKLLNQILGDTK